MVRKDLPEEQVATPPAAAESPLDHAAHEPHLAWPAASESDSDPGSESEQEAVLDVGRKLLNVIPPPTAH